MEDQPQPIVIIVRPEYLLLAHRTVYLIWQVLVLTLGIVAVVTFFVTTWLMFMP